MGMMFRRNRLRQSVTKHASAKAQKHVEVSEMPETAPTQEDKVPQKRRGRKPKKD